MTIIEFFDKELLENIIGALMFRPERVVLFGKDYKKMASFGKRAAQILKDQGIQTEISVKSVNTTDYFSICEMLRSLLDTYPDCIFDLTGGEETVLVAMGAIAGERNIPMRSINPRNGKVKTILPAGGTEKEIRPATLSIGDAVTLFGGTLTGSTVPFCDSQWTQDVLKMWAICKKDCGRWNTAIEYFAAFIDSENPDFDGVTVSVPKKRLEAGLQNSSRRSRCMDAVFSELCTAGIVQVQNFDAFCQYTFKNKTLLEALTKSGTVLELYTLISVLSLKDEQGAPLVQDAVSGAVIDWENPPDADTEDVKNEIDVLATVNAIPVFISCKNGCVDSDELYKLNTVAQRFGGKYAKKLLVMTYFNVPDSFIQRAHALNIRVIRNAQDLSHEEFAEKLKDNIK